MTLLKLIETIKSNPVALEREKEFAEYYSRIPITDLFDPNIKISILREQLEVELLIIDKHLKENGRRI